MASGKLFLGPKPNSRQAYILDPKIFEEAFKLPKLDGSRGSNTCGRIVNSKSGEEVVVVGHGTTWIFNVKYDSIDFYVNFCVFSQPLVNCL